MNAKSERVLSRWALLMVGKNGPIIAGCEDMEIRRTSTLVTFDPDALTGVTASGRPYRLVGEPEPGYALGTFHSLWDAGDTPVRVVAPVRLYARAAGAPRATETSPLGGSDGSSDAPTGRGEGSPAFGFALKEAAGYGATIWEGRRRQSG